ncbi:MAG: ribosome-binding factor A [Candidatus Komeilibacteria bacterium RIFOXYC1_FULL_37_11]|uniref:Ribosome-binding factor A n=1 Tax=Candidatus Komeilibacteria bacterium RIFOXYC1_FULL_37_11 TaxID=1798555 RepID=A0A1G2BYX9_9BACT|nr:MAG: ribosome-binding factor A [Candidatus Komeilibacteria bacterium RIFOXYC1_FULL_37_11]OGY95718.1 MAG: ribosome-binding factor A [Candidatus Komeilibacteria bacterium RIFOXYD1_FULL_37_29]OGY95940.1 MAG: ribosome-binding factor A [Candidatus Komeilibacteria bacterium RIFOXYD2_FULL_37_8]
MNKRIPQVAELLRAEINKIIIRDFEPPIGMLISVSEVTVSDDLKNATAYLSIIPQNKIGTGLAVIQKFAGHVQKNLGKNIKLRVVPKINWQLDERALKYSAIDEALKE